jgi:pilus assembly protein CpaB
MNRKKLWVALIVAGITGLAASLLTVNYLRRPAPAVAAEQPATGTVVVAATPLALGTFLTEAHVKAVPWHAGTLPEGYFASVKDVVGRGLVVDMAANEPILGSKLAPEGAGGGLPVVIPEGKRAVSVKVDEVVGVAGFVLPGTRVDVLVTLDPETEGEGRPKPATTRVILQNVQVIASGQKIEKDEEGKPQTVTVITLLVTPDESEKLTLAATEGKIQMALRNAMDNDSVRTEGIQTGELVSGPIKPAPAAAPAPAPRRPSAAAPRPSTQVEVILGDKRSKETF